MKRVALKRSTPLKRTAALKRTGRRKRKTFPTPLPVALCQQCQQARAVHRHHIIDAQVCERHGAPTDDERNMLLLCGRCHFNHHAWSQRLPAPPEDHRVWELAADFGLVWWLERFLA